MLYSWPNHRIAVMGGEQLAGVLEIIKREAAARRHEEVNEKQLSQQAMLEGVAGALCDLSSWDDGIIDPRDTQTSRHLALCGLKPSYHLLHVIRRLPSLRLRHD